MLSCIDTSAQVGKFDRRECFPKFTEYLQTYFQILDDSIGNAGVSGQLQAFIIELRNLNHQAGSQEYTKLQQLWVNSAGVIKSFDADLYRYLGLCLALAFYSQS